jgi:CTP:molybdopterin cytidylyltransferase MocA
MGPATDDDGTLNIGGRFELEVASALRTCCDEVMVGVKPAGLGQQVDLDLVVRRGPRVGVVECKLARSGAAEKPKQGLDQLMQATDRVAFGSHAVRMLVTGAPMNASLQRLAANRRVKCTWARYRDGHPLDEMEVRRIQQATREAFDTV